MAVTRIKNNQITDSTITYQKIASGTLVGSLFNANLTLNSNVSIAGNLTVTGNTTTVSSIDTLVADNLITLNSGYVGTPAYDVGLLFNRALGSLGNYGGVNAALVWSESDGAFITVLTTETGTTQGTINRAFKANLIAGNITVSNAITAQTATITTLNVSNTNVSGLTSTGNIVAASGTNATNYTTGALVVPDGGGVGITGALYVQGQSTFLGNINAGNIQLSGNINVPVGGTFSNTGTFYGNTGGIGALYAGTTVFTALPTTVLQLTGNVDTYAQVNFQNYNSGTKASTDFVLTADNGNDTDGFLDLGINSSNFADAAYPGFYPNDGYLVHHTATGSGNLIIFSHESGSAIKLHVGDYDTANVRATVTNSGLRVNTSTASSSTTSGALIVDGGAGIAGALNVGGAISASTASFASINNTPIGNATASTGSFTYLTTTTGFSSGNSVITGGYIKSVANIYATDGYITNINSTNGNIVTLVANNFSTANAIITGGNLTLQSPFCPANIALGTFVVADSVQGYMAMFGNLDVFVSANIYNGNFQGSLISSNVIITAGSIDDTNIGDTTPAGAHFTFANVKTITAYTATIKDVNTTSGNITNAQINQLAANTGVVTNFSSGNAVITGGSLNATVIGNATPAAATLTTLSTGNTSITSSYESSSTTTGALVVTGGAGIGGNLFVGGNLTVYGNTTVLNTETLTVEDLNITVASNAATASAADGAGLTVAGANATFTYVSAIDSWQLNKKLYGTESTMVVSNIGTANIGTATVTTIDALTTTTTALNSSNANITNLTAGTTTTVTLNSTSGNVVTLVANNFSSGNVAITAGVIDNTAIGSISPSTGNFTTSNANTVTAYTVTGTTLNTTNGNATTLVATNFSTANARITGGYADNFQIGANVAATGSFTQVTVSGETKTATLNATSNVYLSPQSGAATVTVNPLNPGTIDNMSIGATNAANVYASNFRSATSLWAATTGPVWIRGGTGTSGINNIPIGAVTPSTGAFTTADIATGSITTLNTFAANATTLFATNFSSGNVVISGGYISALTNAYITTGLTTNFSTGNAQVTGGFADNFPIGANTAATGRFTTLTATSINNTVIGNVTPANGTFSILTANTGTFNGAISTTGVTSTGDSSIDGNLIVGQSVTINATKNIYDTVIRGRNENSLIFAVADDVYDQVSIGGNITSANVTQGAKLVVNSTDAMIIPKGTSSQRPGASGFTDVTGMIRYNSTTNELEYYGSTGWKNTGSTFTVIQSRTFSNSSGDINGNVDGSNTNFTLGAESTTAATLVSINGVIQIPSTAYSVTGNVVTFTEAPAVGDVVDTRVITTTSTLSGLASLDGYNQFNADSTGLRFYTGNLLLGSVENWRIDNHGDLFPVTSSNIGYPTNRVEYIYAGNLNISGTITGASLSSGTLDDTIIGANIARAGHFTTLFSDSTFTTNAEHVTDDIRGKYVAPSATDAVYGFSTSTYRSGKFFVQLSSATEYQAAEVIAVHNGTTCSIEVYGVTFTGAANLATFSSNIAGGIAYLNASSAGSNLAIKVTPTLMKI